jgi:hypothetical protein
MMNWKPWLYSLISAVIGAVGNAIPLIIIAPTTFNFTHGGFGKLCEACGGTALIALGLFLAKSPLPPESQVTTVTDTQTHVTTVTPAPTANAAGLPVDEQGRLKQNP